MIKHLQVWRFTEGNRAHEKQSAALIEGLALIADVTVTDIDCRKSSSGWYSAADLKSKPKPDLLIGAGHTTHWPMIRCKWRFGGHLAVIMKPSLPLFLFDSAIIPRHDQPKQRQKIFISQGMLNPAFNSRPELKRGVILLGGINKYFAWDTDSIIQQIRHITQSNPDCQWQVSNSRRTPDDFNYQLIETDNVQWIDWQSEGPEWLPQQLAQASMIWVSCDSMSMIYEALNSRAQLGVLQLPVLKKANKMSREIERLIDQQLLVSGGCNKPYKTRLPLNEHYRAGQWLLSRLPC